MWSTASDEGAWGSLKDVRRLILAGTQDQLARSEVGVPLQHLHRSVPDDCLDRDHSMVRPLEEEAHRVKAEIMVMHVVQFRDAAALGSVQHGPTGLIIEPWAVESSMSVAEYLDSHSREQDGACFAALDFAESGEPLPRPHGWDRAQFLQA